MVKLKEIRIITQNRGTKPNAQKPRLIREIQRRDSRKMKAVWLHQART